MATTTTGAWQVRIEQFVAPDIDVTGVDDHGQAEVQTARTAETTQGFVGHEAGESS